jgi:hypothetical protein
MNRYQLEYYLRAHLGNEIRYLLTAATEWHAQSVMELKEPGHEVQVYAMDSTFVHARSLFEFFTEKTTDFHYGFDIYALDRLRSLLYEKHWKAPLHSHLMHTQDRTATAKLPSFEKDSPPKDLNAMPVDFGQEAVRLWREFTESLVQQHNPELGALGPILDYVLAKAIDAARNVLTNRFTRDYDIAEIAW